MKPLSEAQLRRTAIELHLELADEDLTRLLPMVRDLLQVSGRLRNEYAARIDRTVAREGDAHRPE